MALPLFPWMCWTTLSIAPTQSFPGSLCSCGIAAMSQGCLQLLTCIPGSSQHHAVRGAKLCFPSQCRSSVIWVHWKASLLSGHLQVAPNSTLGLQSSQAQQAAEARGRSLLVTAYGGSRGGRRFERGCLAQRHGGNPQVWRDSNEDSPGAELAPIGLSVQLMPVLLHWVSLEEGSCNSSGAGSRTGRPSFRTS